MTYLAHSAKRERGIPEQEYRDHIENVVGNAVGNADRAAEFSAKYGDLLRASVRLAAEYHDLGKLDEANQEVLRTNRGKMLNHVDAGVAHLLRNASGDSKLLAAIMVFAHHIGLPVWADESTRGTGLILRDTEPTSSGIALREFTNQWLCEYLQRHTNAGAKLQPATTINPKLFQSCTLEDGVVVSRRCGSFRHRSALSRSGRDADHAVVGS